MTESRAPLTTEQRPQRSLPVILALAVAAVLAVWAGSTSVAVLLVLALGIYLAFSPSGRTSSRLDTRVQWLERHVRELQSAVEELRVGVVPLDFHVFPWDRHPPRSRSRNRCRSGGGGMSQTIALPVAGCSNPSSAACRASRGAPLSSDTTVPSGRRLYTASPQTG